jgi:NADH-quinone oxidoreductase subunit L
VHAFVTPVFWLVALGSALAVAIWFWKPQLAVWCRQRFSPLVYVLDHKYWFDEIYQTLFARGSTRLGNGLWRIGDTALIDNLMVNGSATVVGWCAGLLRYLQSGYLYHYAFAMIVGLIMIIFTYIILA